jgi:hypothetical protein
MLRSGRWQCAVALALVGGCFDPTQTPGNSEMGGPEAESTTDEGPGTSSTSDPSSSSESSSPAASDATTRGDTTTTGGEETTSAAESSSDESTSGDSPCDGSDPECGVACDPLIQDCSEGHGCYAFEDAFACLGTLGGSFGDTCDQPNACDAGLVCVAAARVPDCGGAQCCTSFCDLSNPATCTAPGQSCVAWFDPGPAPAGLENVGICALP